MSHRPLAALLLCLLLPGCVGEEPTAVRLHLCPAADLSQTDLEALPNLTWTIEIWGLDGLDATWRTTLGGGRLVDELTLADAIPQGELVRLFVMGLGSGNTIRAMAISAPLSFQGDEDACLCIAPPDQYDRLCPTWSCQLDASAQTCVELR